MTSLPPIAIEITDRRDVLGYRATSCLRAFAGRDEMYWRGARYEEPREACLVALKSTLPNSGDAFDMHRCSDSNGDIVARIAAS